MKRWSRDQTVGLLLIVGALLLALWAIMAGRF